MSICLLYRCPRTGAVWTSSTADRSTKRRWTGPLSHHHPAFWKNSVRWIKRKFWRRKKSILGGWLKDRIARTKCDFVRLDTPSWSKLSKHIYLPVIALTRAFTAVLISLITTNSSLRWAVSSQLGNISLVFLAFITNSIFYFICINQWNLILFISYFSPSRVVKVVPISLILCKYI